MLWFVYRLLTALLAPLWLAFLWLRQGGRLRERLGFLRRCSGGPVWIQAVSAGEARLALKLGAMLEKRGSAVFFTATTAAGLELLRKEGRAPCAFPADLPFAARRAFRRVRPCALVLVETELWPGFIREAAMRDVPVVIANARISDRSLQRTLALRGVFGGNLKDVFVAAQSEEQAERFRSLGVSSGRVTVAGNMKYDLEPPAAFLSQVEALKARLGEPGSPLWVAGSVREGEEALVLKAHALLLGDVAGAKLILAPRHLGRVRVSIEEASRLGLRAARRTDKPGSAWDVIVLDTMGELWAAYSLGHVAFAGGSLVPCGGQNPLEPAFLGKPVLFGPSMENFKEPAALLLAAGGASQVDSPEKLAAELSRLLADSKAREAMGLAARGVIAARRGATVETAGLILAAVRPSDGKG